MKIAVTCENNNVFQHFGHTPGFAIFETNENAVISETFLDSGSSGHGALAALLKEAGVDVLICGGIGAGAINALSQAGIRVIGGAEGSVRTVAEDFVKGSLSVRSDFHCNHHHHEEGHDCGSHSCGGNCSH